ncbi:MAG: response regulator [Desulfobulbaceae bacterium]|nr:MAG: response regulator [Desulfobulbaceae bacterium]
MLPKKIAHSLLSEVQFLIILLSMTIMIAVVAAAALYLSHSKLSSLRSHSLVTADELASLLELPLYNVDNESSVRIAKAFLSSGKISGIELRSIADGTLFTHLSGQDASGIPDITRDIAAGGMPLGSFTITFSDAEIRESQKLFLSISLAIIASVLLANIAASRYIARRVRRPFQTIFSAIEKISAGNYQAQIEPTEYRDINTLVKLFNNMAGKIHQKNLEQKRIEETLVNERQFLIDVIDFLPDATFIIDTDRRVVVWNRAIETLTGIPREDIVGKGEFAYAEPFFGRRQPILIDLLDLPQPELERNYKYIRRTDTTIFAESYIAHMNDGRGMHLWGVAAPIFDHSGKRSGAIEMIRDVTDLKLAEEEKIHLQEQLLQTQKMESVGRLAGGVAHDFNNMLTVILGHTQLAMLGLPETDPTAAHLQIIEETSRRSTDLVRQLLAFARKQTVSPKVIDINDTIERTQAMLKRLIGEDISITWKPGQGLWPVWVDPGQVDQLLINLCVNARDAISGVGEIGLETANIVADAGYCRVNPESLPGEYVMLAVSDTGCGMDKATIDRIFEPFFTTKAIGKGTGMGLATVYGVVRQNKGFINVYSELGKGTTFKVYLPRFSGEEIEIATTGEQPDTTGRGETILVVEDDTLILDICREMLAKLGYQVLPAESPGEALELMRTAKENIHLLITDVVMPEMNGRDLERQLKEINPSLKSLFISGYTAEAIAHHGVLDQDVCFLQKPFSLQDLAVKVRQALDVPGTSRHAE